MSGIVLVISLAVLFLIGVPVAFSMGLSSVLTMAVDTGIRWGTIVQQYINGISSFTVLAIPLFILAGKVMNVGGITDRLFGFARTLVGWLPGGLGHVNVVASVIFSGMSGSAVADVGGLGIIEIKAMDDAGFDHDTSCCITAASSCIGPIIPPSITMVVYAAVSGTSAGALFMAGIVPGLCMALLLMALILGFAIFRKYPRDPFPSLPKISRALIDGFFPLLAPVIILLGIYTGVFTPTESAAVVVAYSLFLGVVVYRALTMKQFWQLVKETVAESAHIGIILAAATLFGTVIVKTMIPQKLLTIVSASIHSKFVFLLVINIFLLIVGMFMESAAAITILTPIMMPMVTAFSINPVHFGIILTLNMVLGGLTPPFGIINLVCARVGRIPFGRLCKRMVPWFGCLLLSLLLVTFIPALSLWLPRTIGLIA